ncbi:hypothetical protein Sa4125_12440 [Aureimonas sp. SA4125]|uniref:baseplate multidomain protein megatron n=1 Tax=Aureimonas sp. SA4125 TaxID=2826993 RepID=UPI001CC48E3A|nr:glycoside hydrolase/phage tail family protein [Aureimonas sp. SA4125]BDA83702.1 hypothetical protein Sa4125_12440 [Aureimonas sp. SA4125]
MATILLQAAGGLVGGLIGGPFGAIAGRALGALGGYALDSALFGQTRRSEGARLGASRILEADEGAGVARLYGQVIWTTRFEETRETSRQGGKGGAPKSETTTYSYAGNVAIGLCEGPIAGIRRVWADGEELDLTGITYRLHRGDETQMPDPLIEAKQGAGNAPAYRGLAYIVFERLPLEAYGNRIPQIACEVIRPVGALEEEIRAVTLIPGASEHGLDPVPMRETVRGGEDILRNRNMLFAASDIEASLDELQALCPRLERVALVVSWFGDDLRAGHCTVRPKVEVSTRDESRPWRVGETERGDALLVSRSGGGPAYGGTPGDQGVVAAIAALRGRGLAVSYYPFLMMDVPAGNGLPDPYGGTEQAAYPWRGRITLDVAPGISGSDDGTPAAAADVAAFVGTATAAQFSLEGGRVRYHGPAKWSYRRMVLHQAHLAKLAGGVDAFIIGSELRGLTRLRDGADGFPFVAALMALAAEVKLVLPDARLTYAADWSEYFGYQPADGSGDVYFNLDPLWAHPAIAMIGIDNYLPLADWRDGDADGAGPDASASPYDASALGRGIAGGEYGDWYYRSDAERAARLRTAITDGLGKPWVFRPKDLVGWWSNSHVERRGGVEVGGPTAFVPGGKPIWFTELGCPAIDKGANQPNVFLDPKSSESLLPHFSTGARDDLIQRRFLEAHLRHWDPDSAGFEEAANPVSPVYGGRMVDPAAIHLWTFDARPYPAFPGRTDVWSDGDNWRRGHWLTGRLGRAPVDALIRRLLADHGFTDVDVTGVDALVGGYVVGGPASARDALEDLLRLCGIVAMAAGGSLVFRSLSALPAARPIEVLAEEEEGPLVTVRRMEASEIPQEIVVGYSDPSRAYQSAAAEALSALAEDPRQETVELPVILEESEARGFAAALLSDRIGACETARFSLSPADIAVDVGDVVTLPATAGRWLISRIETGLTRRVEARKLPARRAGRGDETELPSPLPKVPVTASRPLVHFLDLPVPPSGRIEDAARIAIHARPFVPIAVQIAAVGGEPETRLVQSAPATVGALVSALTPGPEALLDRRTVLEVELWRGALASVTPERLLSGANLAAVRSATGEWEVLQFQDAEEIAPMRFRLSTFLRAQGGTEDAMQAGAAPGAPFVLLDAACSSLDLAGGEIGRALDFRLAPVGRPLDDPAVLRVTHVLGARGVRPLSPVHLRGRFQADGGLDLGWIRRTRIAGDSWDGLDVPLGEEIERYRLTIADDAGAALAMETAVPAAMVSAAAQVATFGALPPRLTVEVAQLSLGFGAGTGRQAVFVRPA